MKRILKIQSLIVVIAMLFTSVSYVSVYVVNAENFVGDIRYDFIESTESFSPYKESMSTSTLSVADDCLKVDYAMSASGAAAGFKTTKFTIDRTLHNYIDFRIKVPTNVLNFRVFMLNADGSVYTSWSKAENGMTNIARDGKFHVYTIDLDNANTHTTRPKSVSNGTYSIRFDIIMKDATAETQTAYLDWLVISQDCYSSKPTLITGALVNGMTFDMNVGDNGYTLCEDTAAYLTLDCTSTIIQACLNDETSTVVSNVTSLTNHKILDISVMNSNSVMASYRFVFVLYQKSNVEDLRWDFMNDSDTEGWVSKNSSTCLIKSENGKLNATTTQDRDAYFSIALDNVDIFNSYRYIHFKARNNSNTNTQLQFYLNSGNFLHKNVTVQQNETEYSVYTLDLNDFVNGSNIPLIESNLCNLLRIDFYNVSSDVTTLDGNMDFDWIVLSQNDEVPKAPAPIYKEEVTYSVIEDGRYRIVGTMTSTGTGSEGAEARVYNNDILVYQSYFPDGENGMADVRILAEAGDVIKTKLILTGNDDIPFMEWNQQVELVNTVIPQNMSSTTLGDNYSIISEALLSDYLGENKPDDVEIYTTLYGVKHYLEWGRIHGCWYLTEPYVRQDNINVSDGRERLEDLVWQNAEIDYNSVYTDMINTSHNPVSGATTYIEIPIKTDGLIKIDGDFVVPETIVNEDGETITLDGELIKVYINDKLIWSNRIGGEVSTRYDEPYDTKYFINNINAFAEVKVGDILKFSFNRWRHNYDGEYIDISDVKIKYVEGDILSTSTVWKLKNSIVADVSKNQLYINGKSEAVQIEKRDDDIYVSLATATKLFENNDLTSADGFVPVCQTTELLGMTTERITEELLVIQNSAINMFTWNEKSEIITEYELHNVVETQDAEFYSGGEKITYLSDIYSKSDIVAKRQVVAGTPENTVGIIPVIALYNNSSMVQCNIGEQVNNLDGTISEIQVTLEDYIYNHGDYIKVYYWDSMGTLIPMLSIQEIN